MDTTSIEGQSYTWTPPNYDLRQEPKNIFTTALSPDESFPQNFTRIAKWCADGSAALAQCENRTFQTLALPPDALAPIDSDVDRPSPSHTAEKKVFRQPSPIVDFAWFPTATCRDPASFCFVASMRECPVKLLDASDGRLRASYRIVDHRERHIAPHSLAFNTTSDKLYCGFEDAIEVFDVQRPGEGVRLHTTPSKKSRDGLRGIVSALAFSADASSGIYAAGTLSPPSLTSSNIALFSEATGETPMLYVGAENERDGNYAIRASVMQLMFNPARPYLLYASFRRRRTIYSWDLRGDVSSPVQTFGDISIQDSERVDAAADNSGMTNQKMRFDIDSGGNCLAIGNQDGSVAIFSSADSLGEPLGSMSSPENMSNRAPALRFVAHEDAVGSVAFHPLEPILLSASGSRHFGSNTADTSSSDEFTSDDEPAITRRRRQLQPRTLDSSVKFWKFASSDLPSE